MFKRLRVQDFQSIALADLELGRFTVIVGDNRSGKTALLRALRALITNKTGSGFIRRGKPRCIVTLDTLEGHSITWQKDKTTASYEMDGRKFSKMAGSVPDDVKQALGVQEVVVDSTLTLMPQMAKDTELLFLLDKPPGQAARALAKLTRLDVVVKAQILCKQFIRSLKDDLKGVEKNIFKVEDELEEFVDLPERQKKNISYAQCYENITKLFGKLSRVNAQMSVFREATDVLNRGSIPPCSVASEELDRLSESVKLYKQLINTVAPGGPPENTEDIPEKLTTLEEAEELKMHHFYNLKNYAEDCEEVAKLGQEKSKLEVQLEKLQGSVCPVCGGTI